MRDDHPAAVSANVCVQLSISWELLSSRTLKAECSMHTKNPSPLKSGGRWCFCPRKKIVSKQSKETFQFHPVFDIGVQSNCLSVLHWKREEARALSAQFPKLSVFNSSKKFWKLKLEGLCHNQCDAFNMWSVSCDWRTHNPLIHGLIKHFGPICAVVKILSFTVLSFRTFQRAMTFTHLGNKKDLQDG